MRKLMQLWKEWADIVYDSIGYLFGWFHTCKAILQNLQTATKMDLFLHPGYKYSYSSIAFSLSVHFKFLGPDAWCPDCCPSLEPKSPLGPLDPRGPLV